jgi:hypothetical protein
MNNNMKNIGGCGMTKEDFDDKYRSIDGNVYDITVSIAPFAHVHSIPRHYWIPAAAMDIIIGGQQQKSNQTRVVKGKITIKGVIFVTQ